MARARNIKPGFFTNEYLSDLQPLARLLFIGLWCHADREGRLEDRPKRLKVDILPYDNCDIDKLLNTLADSPEKFITRYEVGGRRYMQVSNFTKHQNPHIKEPTSTIPAPCKNSANMELVSEQSNRESVIGNQESVMGNGESVAYDEEKMPYKAIVEYLNEKAGTAYKSSSQKTKDLIQARFNEKFTLGDFQIVIDKKVAEWSGTEWQKFIRPETLFSNKFEGYLNQKTQSNNPFA